MKKFKYIAVNINRKKFTGSFMAESEKELRALLAEQNLFLVSAKIEKEQVSSGFFSVGGTVKLTELTAFCRQFSIMINSGISILECLAALRRQNYKATFKKVLEQVYEDVKAGMLLSEAMKKQKNVFPQFFQSMVYVGELSGKLDVVLNSLADYYENDMAIRAKTKGAFSYPLMLLGLTLGIIVLMCGFVIPKFKETLMDMDVEMPALTLAIFNASEWFIGNWTLVLGVVVGIVAAFFIIKSTEKGKFFFDQVKMQIPLFKDIQTNMITSRFARGFGLLLSSGLDMVDSMEVMQEVLGNRYVQKLFGQATEDVRQGMTLTMAFDMYKLFPTIMIQMISIGEKTGTVDEVLQTSSKFFDDQVSQSLQSLTAIIQPVMLCIMGGVIGMLFIAIYSPMLSIMTTISA